MEVQHALGLVLLTAETIVELDGELHLVRARTPEEDSLGELLHLACGPEVFSEFLLPVQAARRGAWHRAGVEGDVGRCAGCVSHESEYPEAGERPELPEAAARELLRAVERLQVDAVPFVDAFSAELVARAHQRAGEVVPALLMSYGKRMRERYGPDFFAAAVSDADWREIVADALEDLREDGAAFAATGVHIALRGVVEQAALRAQPAPASAT